MHLWNLSRIQTKYYKNTHNARLQLFSTNKSPLFSTVLIFRRYTTKWLISYSVGITFTYKSIRWLLPFLWGVVCYEWYENDTGASHAQWRRDTRQTGRPPPPSMRRPSGTVGTCNILNIPQGVTHGIEYETCWILVSFKSCLSSL